MPAVRDGLAWPLSDSSTCCRLPLPRLPARATRSANGSPLGARRRETHMAHAAKSMLHASTCPTITFGDWPSIRPVSIQSAGAAGGGLVGGGRDGGGVAGGEGSKGGGGVDGGGGCKGGGGSEGGGGE